MRKCPKCGSWSFDFDDYFGRFRCFNSRCNWMPASAYERQDYSKGIGLGLEKIRKIHIEELGLTITTKYDHDLDYLIFDFGNNHPSFDLPEPDGRMIWQISSETNEVVGFIIAGPKEFGTYSITINIQARKKEIEDELKAIWGVAGRHQITRNIIENIMIKTESARSADQRQPNKINSECNKLLSDFQPAKLSCASAC